MMKVVGVDYPCMDYIIEVDRIPATNGEADIQHYSWQGGGMVSTALTALGRLGIETQIIGVIGDDIYGRFCIDDFKRHKVDVSLLRREENKTTDFCISIAEKETAGRSFITRWGDRGLLSENDIDISAIEQADFLHLCGKMNEVNCFVAKAAKEAGTKVVLDADQYDKSIEDNLELIDVLIPSEFFYQTLFSDTDYEKNIKSLIKKGPQTVVFTLGEKGCAGIQEGRFFRTPAYSVQVTDTTGAGDVFHGAYIYGLMQGWEGERIAKFAGAVSAIKCTRLGGRAGIPDLKTVEEFCRSGQIDYKEIDKRAKFYQQGLDYLLNEPVNE